MNEIFCLNGLNACTQDRRGIVYSCCAKVSLQSTFGKSIIGYVTNEDDEYLFVFLENRSNISVRRPHFDKKIGSYVYDIVAHGHDDYYITQYWPIRFKLNVSGKTSFTLNRFVMRKNNNGNVVNLI